jgi:serine phosphatase RsbU (regulator of sigma subunit)
VFTLGGMVVAAEMYERDLMTLERTRLQVAAAEEHRLVVRFQRLSLPPEAMSGSAFTAEGRYVASSSGLGVGGDWYDVAELPDGRVYICVGDVVGHGAEAAVTMSQLRIAMSILAGHVDRPSELLAQADLAASTIPGASCSTAWVGFFDPKSRSLAYASAGHPPGFLLTADGVVRPGDPKPETVVEIPSDASLLLYTDGLVDRRGGTIDGHIDDIERELDEMWSSGTGVDLDALEALTGRTDDTVVLHVALRPFAP